MIEQPVQFSEKYASVFRDESVVAAYSHRPPYPEAVFDVLKRTTF